MWVIWFGTSLLVKWRASESTQASTVTSFLLVQVVVVVILTYSKSILLPDWNSRFFTSWSHESVILNKQGCSSCTTTVCVSVSSKPGGYKRRCVYGHWAQWTVRAEGKFEWHKSEGGEKEKRLTQQVKLDEGKASARPGSKTKVDGTWPWILRGKRDIRNRLDYTIRGSYTEMGDKF